MKNKFLISLIVTTTAHVAVAQVNLNTIGNNLGEIHGNFQANAQYYVPDSTIGAAAVPEKMLMNGFANFIYSNDYF